jgi:hypothetical protein
MLATATQTVKQTTRQAAPSPSPIFVTLAYAWGFEDGAQGERRRAWAYFTFTDPRYEEYATGYAAGVVAGNRNQ